MNDTMSSMPIIGTILSNLVYTSIILSIIILIMVMTILPCKSGTSSTQVLKAFVYVLITNAIVFALHNSSVSNMYREKYANAEIGTFMGNINRKTGGAYTVDNIKVSPQFKPDTRTEKEVLESESQAQRSQASISYVGQSPAHDLLDKIENRL
jgi:hypothetical protein